jgi:hypothetical protein
LSRFAVVAQFIHDWFEVLDVHAPLEETLKLVAAEGLVMRLPEVTAYGIEGFTEWYERVIGVFFDEIHTIHALQITLGEPAKVEMILQWEPTIWSPPAAKSTRKSFFAAQTWELLRSPDTQKTCIVTYNVDYFIPAPGSEDL